ncbi:hypoxanthine-guanine phosphoribosyltransferase [Coralloluteibacterium thermophilus]|uniref:Hypoxanthine-guanine phosphoribosyltransferase n=1 Tax=Coralloluteibacterium thermophilum TaxID=2707049 RepID=A0ABV9NMZ8_9GAMM
MTTRPDLSDALANAELLFDRVAIDAAIADMAERIRADYAGARPLYLTVMNGALPFAGLLALQVGEGVDLEFDYLHATRYRGHTSGGELHWLHRPRTPLAGRRVLLVDDILDEGHTLAGIRDWCLGEGAAEVRIAAMTRKDHDRCVPGLVADYVGIDVPDRYVFGFGMDYHEQGRNLPAIYALKD